MFFLVIFLAAFSIIRNGERTIDFDSINYLDSKFKFISVESVDKLLKQSDSISLKLMKRNLNLGSLERIINKNAFLVQTYTGLQFSVVGALQGMRSPNLELVNDAYTLALLPDGEKVLLKFNQAFCDPDPLQLEAMFQ
jgi:hypothetical protein